ncbi:MAG: phosphonoacetaldehyde hydrolase [Betaproteobacteria bacterium]|jgi:phosphonoacetaldehyde hydrolase|nr:phosphonoacetaldehyde hydrolase [Betaproteobacteria bacterium]NBT68760.1 phosphonoacetaldehyde hydrolase [Betaproteobacteria bacterium]
MKKIKGIVLDWAGTIVDFGSLAPMGAFVELFARHQIHITIEQARIPMGLPKIDHIIALGQMKEISNQWTKIYNRTFNSVDAKNLLLEFEPMSAKAAIERSDFIPGFLEIYKQLSKQGIRFASTTGYTRKIMTPLIEKAQSLGFSPELVICCDDVAKSRPDPMGMYECLKAMDLVGQSDQVIKVDDTKPGIAEGLAAGCWTIGVSASGNALGWSLESWKSAGPSEKDMAISKATQSLKKAGAHLVIESVANLASAIEKFENENYSLDRKEFQN